MAASSASSQRRATIFIGDRYWSASARHHRSGDRGTSLPASSRAARRRRVITPAATAAPTPPRRRWLRSSLSADESATALSPRPRRASSSLSLRFLDRWTCDPIARPQHRLIAFVDGFNRARFGAGILLALTLQPARARRFIIGLVFLTSPRWCMPSSSPAIHNVHHRQLRPWIRMVIALVASSSPR